LDDGRRSATKLSICSPTLRRRSRNVNGSPTGLEILKHAIDRFGILITGGDRIEVLFREVILDAQHPQTHADRK
jgi:hypothetical protein